MKGLKEKLRQHTEIKKFQQQMGENRERKRQDYAKKIKGEKDYRVQ